MERGASIKAIRGGTAPEALVGVGLRDVHYSDILGQRDALDFVEVHAENFFVDGGPALAVLQEVREAMAVSLHATSMGLASEGLLTRSELQSLLRLVDVIDPLLVSDHACFSWTRGEGGLLHGGDLLPIAYNPKTLDFFAANVDRVQQVLGRKLIIENISAYLSWPDNTMREFEFLQRVCARTGAGILLDINNIYVNVVNAGCEFPLESAQRILSGIDGEVVDEIHLAGSSAAKGGELLIDDHAAEVSETVWAAYRYAVTRMGAKPTLIEWDTQLPEFSVLVQQANRARRETRACSE